MTFHSLTLIRLEPRYQLANQAMLGSTNKTLAKKVSFDDKKQEYVFNKQATKSPASKLPQALLSKQTTSDDSTAKDNSYTATVAKDKDGAITVSNPELDVSFSMTPTFHTYEGRQYTNRVAYPLKDTAASMVYSFKNNGIKEDIMLDKSIGDTLSLQYKLQLPKSLEAQMMTDGSIGVYSADPMLYNNITFGSDKDKALIEKARENGAKTNLVFVIPSPTITQAHPSSKASPTASFKLGKVTEGSQLFSMHAKGLDRANYPLSIDPSVVITSASDFMNGNNEGDITYASGSAARDTLAASGMLKTWAATTNFTTARTLAASVAYNGYLYVMGGTNITNLAFYADTQYAPINANGTLGAWTATTSFAGGRYGMKGLAYNGYLYMSGGYTSLFANAADVQFARINANGSVGNWTTTTSLPTARMGHASLAYNGYMYTVGGKTMGGIYYSDVQYARFNGNGSIGAWTATTSITSTTANFGSAIYNGFIYVLGGSGAAGSTTSNVNYARINANGSVGNWTNTTSLTSARYGFNTTVSNGYMYVLGGTDAPSTLVGYTQYAIINANGSLGAWVTTNSYATARTDQSAVMHNGYMYVLGGNTGTVQNDVQLSSLAPTGSVGLGAATTAFTTARQGHTAVAYRGYLYVMGGTTGGSGYLATTQYAPINSTGTIGTWTATTSFATARSNFGAVAYNGYMYITGGYNDVSLHQSDTQYAVINTAGTLGAWAATTAFTTARQQHTSVVSNGYLYIMGGNNGSNLADVQYASINVNGTLGTWASTTSLTSARSQSAAVVYNGYVYSLGGIDSGFAPTEYAVLNGDGTIGAWTTTTTFATPRRALSASAYNGYMYITGGQAAGYQADTQFAPINANGTLGAWTTTASFATARSYHTTVAYNGYIYVIGGTSDGTTNLSDIQYALISGVTTGATGAWTSGAFTTSRYGHASVVYKGYMYITGGTDGTTNQSLVQYSLISTTGALGVFTATTSFTGARQGHTSVAYNGYLYVLGGFSGSTYYDTVQYAPINVGTVGAWTTTTSFTTQRQGHTSVAIGGYMYVLGGSNGSTYYADTQYAPINADGSVGAWATSTSFTTARHEHTSVVQNGFVYVLGGYTGSNNLADVQFAPINANGTLGTWVATTSFITARQSHASAIYNGYIYVTGGSNGKNLADVQYAPINTNGTIGAWTTSITSFAVARSGLTAIAYNNFMYILGGTTGTALNTYQYAPITATTPVIAGQTTDTSFTTARQQHTAVIYGGYIYVLGGNATGTALADVQYAPVNAIGSLGAWATTTSFSTPRYAHTSVVHNGYVYVIGGYNGTTAYSDVQYAPFSANGTLGSWATTTALAAPRYSHTSAVYNGYVYAVGGTSSGTALADSQYAPINADGTLGTWATTTSMATARYGHTTVTYAGYLYATGGWNGTAYFADTEYARFNANGTLGAWTTTASMPIARYGHASVVNNGYLYVFGGNSSGTALTDTQYAPIYANGSIGPWSTGLLLSAVRYNHTATIFAGYIYLSGGMSTGGVLAANTIRTTVALDSQPLAANYSRSFDLGFTASPTKLTITYVGSGTADISFAATPSTSGVSGPVRTIKNYISGTEIPLSSGTAQYMWVRVALSDDNNKILSGSIGTAVTNITITYDTVLTSTDSILRHGSFFGGGVEQPFDTNPE